MHYSLAVSLGRGNHTLEAEAEAAYLTSVQLNPEHADALNNLCLLLVGQVRIIRLGQGLQPSIKAITVLVKHGTQESTKNEQNCTRQVATSAFFPRVKGPCLTRTVILSNATTALAAQREFGVREGV